MRRLLVLMIIPAALVACGGKQLYTERDLREVKQTYAVLVPLYLDFRTAYRRGDGHEMVEDYRREQRVCRAVDSIDKRDTIDPNTNLFQVSAGLDNLCNDIESVYAAWEKAHGKPYDKRVIPAFASEAFQGTDKELKDMRKDLRHPSALS